jgi:glycosyltransferase involved in cell wall biosynthesis
MSSAVSLAQRLETNLVLQANAAEDMEQLERVVRLAPTRRLSFAATTEPIAAAIDEQLEERIPVASLPPGVHAEKQSPTPREPENPLSAVVSGNGRLDTQYAGLLQAMVQIIDRYPQTQFFFDGQGSDQHRLWREAERLHLLPNMSFIPRRLGHREMLLRADVLIQPQALNRSRRLTLQAMARGVPILAQRDRWLDYLIPEWTAYVLDESSPEGWVYLLTRLIEEPELGQKLGESAQQWVSENRLAADQIGRALELYQRISGAPAASSR